MKLGSVIKITKGQNWLIPRYEEFLYSQRNSRSEAARAAEIIDGRTTRDRSLSWSASSAGRCQREQVLSRMRAPKEPYSVSTMEIFEMGDYVHLKHQVAGLEAGYLTEVEVPVSLPELGVRGTMDGKCEDGGGAEFKSINSYGFGGVSSFGPKEEHLEQVTSYMLASGLKFFRILYENKDNQELKEFRVDLDEDRAEKVLAGWRTMNAHLESGTLPPVLQECMNLEGRYRQCPYASVCLEIADNPELLTRLTSSSDRP